MKHLSGRSSDFNKDTIVDLEQPEKLEDFSWLGSDFVDTPQPDNEIDLRFSWDKEITSGLSDSTKPDVLTLFPLVFNYVLLGTLENDLAFGFPSLTGFDGLGKFVGAGLLVDFALF